MKTARSLRHRAGSIILCWGSRDRNSRHSLNCVVLIGFNSARCDFRGRFVQGFLIHNSSLLFCGENSLSGRHRRFGNAHRKPAKTTKPLEKSK